MPLEMLERDLVLATVMPGHGQPPPPAEAPSAPDAVPGEDEPEGDPS